MPDIVALKLNSDFKRAYWRGKVQTHSALVTYALKNRSGFCRVGITTGKKIGSAVERNRCRRIIKAAYRSLAPRCSGGWDLVFVARERTKQMKSTQLEAVMFRQLAAAGVIPENARV